MLEIKLLTFVEVRAGLHHGPWNWTMEDGIFPWFHLVVQFPWSNSSKYQLDYKAFGPLTRCKPNVNQEEWPCTKSEWAEFLNICPKTVVWKKKFKFDHSFVFIFSSQKYFIKNHYNVISLPWALTFFLIKHLFCFSHRKTRWTMSVDNVGLKICLLGTLNFMVTLTFFPWCKPKWSRNEFNNQSQILQGLGTTSRPMM